MAELSPQIVSFGEIHELEPTVLAEIVAMHMECMPDTLTSRRGNKAVSGLYKRLLITGGEIVVLVHQGSAIGVLALSKNHRKLASVRSVTQNFTSWFKVIFQLGPVETLFRILDTVMISRIVADKAESSIYISTLFVRTDKRTLGVASFLIDYAKRAATEMNCFLLVDTLLKNEPAQLLYKKHRFSMYAETRRSMILELPRTRVEVSK